MLVDWQRGRRFAPSAWIHRKNRWVPYWCLYCTKLAPIFKTNDVARSACVVKRNCPVRSEKAPRTGEYASNPERKNTPCISDLAGGKFLFGKERVFFFPCSALQVFGQCVGLQYGLGKTKIYFSGEKDFWFCLGWFPACEMRHGKIWQGIFNFIYLQYIIYAKLCK